MERNIFKLEQEQLKEIALTLQKKVEEGLAKDNAEIQCLPTFITPRSKGINGKALVLDLGGTNYRVATVNFADDKATIHPDNGWKRICPL